MTVLLAIYFTDFEVEKRTLWDFQAMADSDDDFDRRNVRDKFHHERNDYDRHDNRRGPNWDDRWFCSYLIQFNWWSPRFNERPKLLYILIMCHTNYRYIHLMKLEMCFTMWQTIQYNQFFCLFRPPWGNRNRDRREVFRDFPRSRRDRFSPQRREGSPPDVKRMRRDW